MRKIYLRFISTYSYPNLWFNYSNSSVTNAISTIKKKQEDLLIVSQQSSFPFFATTGIPSFAPGFAYPPFVTINPRKENVNSFECMPQRSKKN